MASRAGAEHIAEGNNADMVAGLAASKSLAHPRAWQLPTFLSPRSCVPLASARDGRGDASEARWE